MISVNSVGNTYLCGSLDTNEYWVNLLSDSNIFYNKSISLVTILRRVKIVTWSLKNMCMYMADKNDRLLVIFIKTK